MGRAELETRECGFVGRRPWESNSCCSALQSEMLLSSSKLLLLYPFLCALPLSLSPSPRGGKCGVILLMHRAIGAYFDLHMKTADPQLFFQFLHMVTWALLPRWASPLLILSPHLSRRNLLPSTIYSTALLGRTSGRLLHISSSIPPARIGRQVRARNSNRLPGSCSFCCGVEASVAVASDDNYGNKQVISVTPRLYDYLLTNVREPEILRELREETATMRGSQMQVSPDQAQLLAMLVQILGAEKCIEVGVYTGYSSLAIALVLPESGRLVACERDAVCLEVAKRYYDRAGVSHKVDVKHGLAADVLRSMIQLGETCSYDFAFVDAEKRMYQEYFELLLQLVRVGGLIVMDNVLWHGKVANPLVMDSKTLSIRNFNRSVMEDKRVSISMVPIGDGMTICRKL